MAKKSTSMDSNSMNRPEGAGVMLGSNDYAKAAGLTDSPVPGSATQPMRNQAGAASRLASAPTGDTFPTDGVLGRG